MAIHPPCNQFVGSFPVPCAGRVKVGLSPHFGVKFSVLDAPLLLFLSFCKPKAAKLHPDGLLLFEISLLALVGLS